MINRVPGGAMPFDWTINPYRGCMHACVYCFARPTHTYLDMDAGRDFETKIVVKVNAPEVLGRELACAPVEGRPHRDGHRHRPLPAGRGPLPADARHPEALITQRNPFSILTKGSLILRDVDLLRRRPRSLRSRRRSRSERSTRASGGDRAGDAEPARSRMDAVRTAQRRRNPHRGPDRARPSGISDGADQLHAVVEAAVDAGATHVSPILLHLRPGVREEFLPWLEANRPDLVPATARSIEAPTARSASGDACRDGWTERWPESATRSRPAVSVR